MYLEVKNTLFLEFPCPRCGNYYYFKWFYSNPFAQKCLQCKLLKMWGSVDRAAD